MKTQKTWLTIHFYEGESHIEATLNYETKNYSLTHGGNDENVLFSSKCDNGEIKKSFDRLKCVTAALKFIKQELAI